MGLRDRTVYGIIKYNAWLHRDAVALISEEKRVSHSDFLEHVDRLATGLLAAGLTKGDRIGVLARNSLEYVYLYAAASCTGVIMLPINWRLKTEEVEYVISDGKPKALFVDPEFRPIVASLMPKLGFVKHFFTLAKAEEGFRAFNTLTEKCATHLETNVCDEDTYVTIHTAAVHGKPRGAMVTQRGLLTSASQLQCFWRLGKHDVSLLMLPLFHVAALEQLMCTLVAAASSVVLPGFEVDSGLKHIEEDKVTFLGEFAPMLKMLLDRADERGSDISSLKHIFGLDSPDTITRFQEATGGTFWSVYGQSETSGLISAAPYSERPGSAGLPFPLAEVGIVDEHGNLVAAGISGEIVVRGPMVFRGYWDLDNETEYTFRDNFHHTGDIGYVDGDGYLWFKGRAPEKDLIKSGGENVYPTEVEKVVLGHPSVKDAVVIGVPDSRWGEAVRAVCELNKGESTSEAELIEFVGTHIAGFKKPKSVVFVSKLPTKEDGSVDREKVKEEFGRG